MPICGCGQDDDANDEEEGNDNDKSEADIEHLGPAENICTSAAIFKTKTSKRCGCGNKYRKRWHLKKSLLYENHVETFKSDEFPKLSPEDLVTVHYLAKYSYEDLQYHLEMADTLFKQNNLPNDSEYKLAGKTWNELKDRNLDDAMNPEFKFKSTYFDMKPK